MNLALRYFQRHSTIFTSIVSILLGFGVGALALLLTGHNPWIAYKEMFVNSLGQPNGLGQSLVQITALILTGLAIAIAYRAGLFNIGVEGQFIIGKLAAFATAFYSPLPEVATVFFAIVVGMIASAVWGSILGWLKIWRGVHEVISGIMMNFIALYLSNIVIRRWFSTNNSTASEPLPTFTSFNWESLIRFFEDAPGIHMGIFLALSAAILLHVFLSRTHWGFKVRITGQSPQVASYAGISSQKVTIFVMALSGALAGLAGVCEVLGVTHRVSANPAFEQQGFEGIAVAFLGAATPLGVVLAATLFGVLQNGARDLEMIHVSKQIAEIVIAAVLFMVAANISQRLLTRWRARKKVRSQHV